MIPPVAIVATGTTQGSHTPRWISMLAKQEAPVLIAFDAEKNGDTAAHWWIQRLENAQRLRPWWNDVNQMLQDGADLKEWLAMGFGEREGVQPIVALPEEEISLNCCVCGKGVENYSPDGKAFCQTHWEERLNCCVCGKGVEYYSPDGEAFCEAHWEARLHPSVVVTTQAPSYGHPLTSAQEIMAFVEQWRTVHYDLLVIDLETTGLDPRTHKVVSIAFGTPEQVTILDMRGYYRCDLAHQQVWKEAVQHLLHRDATTWIGHNLKFDLSFLEHQFGVKLAQVYDTMLVEKLLHVGNPVSASLLVSAERYGITVTKEQQSWFIALDTCSAEWTAPFPDEQLTSICQDIEVPYQIHTLQQEMIARHNLARVVLSGVLVT